MSILFNFGLEEIKIFKVLNVIRKITFHLNGLQDFLPLENLY